MGKVLADFKLLSGSIDNLVVLGKVHDPELYNSLRSNRDRIIEVGDNHDNCFGSLDISSLEKSVEKTSSDIVGLASKTDEAMNMIYLYSLGDTKEITLFDKNYKVSSYSFDNEWFYFRNRFYNNDLSLKEKLSHGQITANYDADYYNKILNEILNGSGNQREKIVNSAIFMSTMFPHLPYFWGGGHYTNFSGVDSSWGTDRLVTAPGDETSGTYQPYSLDCSGYVDWLFYNGGVSTDKTNYLSLVGDYDGLGWSESITSPGVQSRVRAGDLAEMDGHVGVVVATNGNIVTVSHCSGSGKGMSLTNINMDTGLVEEDSSLKSRKGDKYFTKIIHVDYDDDVDLEEENNKKKKNKE